MDISKMKELLELCAMVTRKTKADAFFYYSPFCIEIRIYERGFSENETSEAYAAYTKYDVEDVYRRAKKRLKELLGGI